MKTSTIIIWIIVAVVVVLGGWYWYMTMSTGSSTSTTEPTTTTGQTSTEKTSAAATPVVTVATNPKLGAYLVAANGMTLYTYAKDTTGVSNCSGTCTNNWIPYTPTPNESLVAGDNATGILAVITRTDGIMQVTYNGKPLYFWKGDVKSGDITGNKVGGVWLVAKP